MSMTARKLTVVDGGMPPGSGGGGESGNDDWRQAIVFNREGRPEGSAHNLLLIMQHDPLLKDLFVLDEFANKVLLTRLPPWHGGSRDEFTEVDATEFAAWFGDPKNYRMNCNTDFLMSCVEAMARRKTVHPVREYLQSLVWDGIPRIERMFSAYYGAVDNNYTRVAAKCFMVSAVSRILWVDPVTRHNGSKVDFMVILEGLTGLGKSTSVSDLFSAAWFAETMATPSDKDFFQAMKGCWCMEIAELDSFGKADVTKIKQTITSRFDKYRASYARVVRSYRRECIFVGTTNENQYLRDATGGRRFLPIVCGVFRLDLIRKHRDQLWAEAVHLYKAGYPWWELPPEAKDEQEKRYQADSWEDVISRWLSFDQGVDKYPSRLSTCSSIEWCTTTELLCFPLHIEVGKHTRADQMRLSTVMKRLGWHADRPTIGGKQQRVWVRSPEVSDAPVPF